jgi:hypothetical protein
LLQGSKGFDVPIELRVSFQSSRLEFLHWTWVIVIWCTELFWMSRVHPPSAIALFCSLLSSFFRPLFLKTQESRYPAGKGSFIHTKHIKHSHSLILCWVDLQEVQGNEEPTNLYFTSLNQIVTLQVFVDLWQDFRRCSEMRQKTLFISSSCSSFNLLISSRKRWEAPPTA